jgi:hypothetical protein
MFPYMTGRIWQGGLKYVRRHRAHRAVRIETGIGNADMIGSPVTLRR